MTAVCSPNGSASSSKMIVELLTGRPIHRIFFQVQRQLRSMFSKWIRMESQFPHSDTVAFHKFSLREVRYTTPSVAHLAIMRRAGPNSARPFISSLRSLNCFYFNFSLLDEPDKTPRDFIIIGTAVYGIGWMGIKTLSFFYITRCKEAAN